MIAGEERRSDRHRSSVDRESSGGLHGRRRVLGVAASAAVVSLAGCLGGDDDGGTGDDAGDAGGAGEGDDGESGAGGADIPENAYEGPTGDEPEPVQAVGYYYAAVTANDAETTHEYEHSEYPWGGRSADDLAEVVWFDDLTIELVEEGVDEGTIEDLPMYSFASSRSRDAILEAVEGEETALVSVEGTGEEEGEEIHRQAEHLLVTEDGQWTVAL